MFPCQIQVIYMTLKDAILGQEYIIKEIETDDEELDAFLFSLGCYSGELITVVSHLKGGCIVSIKDGRYNIDNQLAEAIIIQNKPVSADYFLALSQRTLTKQNNPFY